MTADDRPSIAELQRLCRDDGESHDADLALAAPALVEIAAAALALREQEGSAAKLRHALRERYRASDADYAAVDVADTELVARRDRLITALAAVRP